MIIISGASKGIGKYLFNKYQNNKEYVLGIYNKTLPEDINVQKELYFKVDITNTDNIIEFIKKIEPKLSMIKLVNCAGINYNAYAHKTNIDLWQEVINVNLIGTFNLIRLLLPYMRRDMFGRIVNFSSVTAKLGTPGISAYAASKSALWGMTKSIAVENAKKGITINNINLGYFDIGMIKEVPDNYLKELINKIPTQKLGNPQNIYNTVEYIFNTDYLNGISIDINGGLY